jgi:hypothetical protein
MLFILRAGFLAFVLSCIHSYIHIVTFAAPVSITYDNFVASGSYSKIVHLSQRSIITPDKSFANADVVQLGERSGYLVAWRNLGIDTSHSPIVKSSEKRVILEPQNALQTQEPRPQVLVRRKISTNIKGGLKSRQWVVLFSIC